jgi:hypothetical protein
MQFAEREWVKLGNRQTSPIGTGSEELNLSPGLSCALIRNARIILKYVYGRRLMIP